MHNHRFYFFLSPEEIKDVNNIFQRIETFTRSGHYFYDLDCGEFLCLEDAQEHLDKIREIFERS